MDPSDTELAERCPNAGCDSRLVRVSADDDANPHGRDAIVCPACLELLRVE